MVSTWKKKKGKTSKLVDAGSHNWNEREGNQECGMDWQRRMEKKNKIKILYTE